MARSSRCALTCQVFAACERWILGLASRAILVREPVKTNACNSYCASNSRIARKAVSDKTLPISYGIKVRHTTSWGSLYSGHNIWYCTKLKLNPMPFTSAFHRKSININQKSAALLHCCHTSRVTMYDVNVQILAELCQKWPLGESQ